MEIASGVAVIGDEKFAAALATTPTAAPEVEPAPAAPIEVPVTVDKHGNIVGDPSLLPDSVRAQLETPETRAEIAALWRKNQGYDKEPLPGPRYLPVPVTGIRNLNVAGVDRRTRRKLFRKMSKSTIRSLRHEQQPQH